MKIHILYSTTSGNTKIAINCVEEMLREKGMVLSIGCAEQTHELPPADVYIFACGTYGHGLLQERMQKWIETYGAQLDLGGKPCTAIGLGDTKYDPQYLCESAVILSDFIQTRGGNLIISALHIIKNPLKRLELIRNWVELLVSTLQSGNNEK